VAPGGVMNMAAFAPTNGASPLQLNFDYALTTQYGGSFSVNNLTQNGYTTGQLSGVDIDNEGVVFARFTNGNATSLGKIALAKFQNPQGLRQKGDTAWNETFTSGDVQIGEAGTSSFGLIQSGALENSNVDIAAQLVQLITAQRNFQANAQVISTADTVTQTVINIR
jgi:flagellar hook protein FlgE